MRILGRIFAILVAGAWCAALGVLIWAVWRLGETTMFDHRGLTANVSNNLTRSDQTLATVILIALIVPAVLAILGALAPGRSRVVAHDARDGRVTDDRYSRLESRISRLEGIDRPVTYIDRDRETVPVAAPVVAKERRRGFFDRLFHHDRTARAV